MCIFSQAKTWRFNAFICDKYSLFPAELLSLVFVTEDLLPNAIWEDADNSLEDPSENPIAEGVSGSFLFSLAVSADTVDPKENPLEAGFAEFIDETEATVSGFDFSLDTAEPNINPDVVDDFTLSLLLTDFAPKPRLELVAAGFSVEGPVPKLNPEAAALPPVAAAELPKEKPLAGAAPSLEVSLDLAGAASAFSSDFLSVSGLAPKAKPPVVLLESADLAPNSGNLTVPDPGAEPAPNIGAAVVVADPNFGEVAPDPNTGVDAPRDPNVGAGFSSDFPKL